MVEAFDRAQKAYISVTENMPLGAGFKIHILITVERPEVSK